MGEWQNIESAPTDGAWIQAEIPFHGSDNIIAFIGGFVDENENECAGWAFMTEQEPPDCWTDGVCWESNEHNESSVKPIRWKELVRQ